MKALAWVFPPEELQELDNLDEKRPGIAFVRDTVRRLVRVPALHALTLFNTVEHYHFGEQPFRGPDNFYREPLSDTIPRERIYEIWKLTANGGQGTVRWGKSIVKTQSELMEAFGRTLDSQSFALSSIAWKLRQDFSGRLKAAAPRINLVVPSWTRGVAHDSQLWIAWSKFENAFGRTRSHLLYLADPEEAEASHEGLRLPSVREHHADGSWTCDVAPDSLNTKLRAPESYLCLSVDAVPGFLALPVRAVVALPEDLGLYGNVPLHKVFGVTLREFDRTTGTAVIALNDFWGDRADDFRRLRNLLVRELGDDIEQNLTLVPGLGSDITPERLRKILTEVANPPIAQPAQNALAALGTATKKTKAGTSRVTPAARVLWEAGKLADTRVRTIDVAVEIADLADQRGSLNTSQRGAVETAAGKSLTVIWGPPGTGKTKTCVGFLHGVIVHEGRRKKGAPYAILVSGPTHKAVGEVIERLGKALSNDNQAPCKLYLINGAGRTDPLPEPKAPGPHLRVVSTIADQKEPGFQALAADLLKGSHVLVVAAVTHQCARIAERLGGQLGHATGMLKPLFDLTLIDESSQVDIATGTFPLALLKDSFQLVVAGDHLQMPPIFRTDPPLGAEHLVGSLQTYFIKRFEAQTADLLQNYRSHADIVAYTRRLGYPRGLSAANPETRIRLLKNATALKDDLITTGVPWSDQWLSLLDPAHPICAVTYPDGMAGQANPFEAECVAATAWLLRQASSCALDGRPNQASHGPWSDKNFWEYGLGIVTPHRAQRAQVVQQLQRLFPDVQPILIDNAVDTVERFQGGERHTILISFGVGDPDVIQGEERFLLQLERTNVAISRAMAKCILFLSEEMAAHVPTDRQAAASAHALRGVVDEWCTTRIPGQATWTDRPLRKLTLRYR